MARALKISVGQFSDRGRKETNQDFHGVLIPDEPLLGLKGAAIAIADGVSSSKVSRIASESAVKSFLTDYYCTSETWSVKTSARRVITAMNSWLYAQTRRGPDPFDKDKGFVCTFSVLVVKSNSAHIFHIGDARVYRLIGGSLEQLTEDHRVLVSSEQTYLGRALGMNAQVEIDYQMVPISRGDVFLLATDGVYEHVGAGFIANAVKENAADLDAAAQIIVEQALLRNSPDNLTIQIVRIEDTPDAAASEVLEKTLELPLPPPLEARMVFEGYKIVRELRKNNRSHIFLAADSETGDLVVIKTPSVELGPAHLKRFMMEEWVARRINNAHVLKPCPQSRRRNALYVVTEYIDGQTLAQWMIDNPRPDLETVRGIVEQIAVGLRAFHRKEMLHQDLRPENIMIDKSGTVKIIDFGSTKVAGVAEGSSPADGDEILGSVQYAAPEYFLGEGGSSHSDVFSLGVIAYQMLTGRLPYGVKIAMARTRSQQRKLKYASALEDSRAIPAWVDDVLKKAVCLDRGKRYSEPSEFVYDLRHPAKDFEARRTPLMERNPLLFWKCLSLGLGFIILALLAKLSAVRP